jgi:predicted ABC-type transport system involved in lysophospholipase L1 biosynthesis ATPase subunit
LTEAGRRNHRLGRLSRRRSGSASGPGAKIIESLAGLAGRRGTTVIVATHDAGLAGRAPRRLRMQDGRLLSPTLA